MIESGKKVILGGFFAPAKPSITSIFKSCGKSRYFSLRYNVK